MTRRRALPRYANLRDGGSIDAEGPLGAWVLWAFVVWAIILGVGFVLWGPL